MDLAPEPATRDQRHSVHPRGVAVRERHGDTAAKRVTDDRHTVVAEDLQQVAKGAGVAFKRVVSVSGSVRLTMSEQVRRDHGVRAREDGNHLPPGERVIKQAVHQKQRWTAAGDPIHQAMVVQEHLIARDTRKIDRSPQSAPPRRFGSVAASPCG